MFRFYAVRTIAGIFAAATPERLWAYGVPCPVSVRCKTGKFNFPAAVARWRGFLPEGTTLEII